MYISKGAQLFMKFGRLITLTSQNEVSACLFTESTYNMQKIYMKILYLCM